MNISLIESLSEGTKARIRIASEGMGSSGYYSAEVLERDGSAAFPAGSFLVKNHITESESFERNGSRRIEDIVGKLTSDAEYVPEERALYAEALFYSKDSALVSAMWQDIDLSLEASGRKDDSGNILELLPHPNNAVALVPNGGRDGKITEFYESLHQPEMVLVESGKIEGSTNSNEKEISKMTPEDIEKITSALTEALEPMITGIREAITAAVPEKETPEVPEDAVSTETVVEAIIAADLPSDLRARVYKSETPLELIEDFKAIRESIGKVAPVGKIQESVSAPASFNSNLWKAGR